MRCSRGLSIPFGATRHKNGINFSIHCKEAQRISLCLFDEYEPNRPFEKILLDAKKNKSGSIWHIWVEGLPENFAYAYEITPINNENHNYLILDPYAKSVVSDAKWHQSSRKKFKYHPLGKFFSDTFDWENDVPPNIPKNELIIYEMHVRGFTNHPSSNVKNPGTFKGMIEKIPYLKDLGINAVELLPIQEFCEEDVIHTNPNTRKKLHNYFGYSTANFFSPMNRYASESKQNKCAYELKSLIKELHKNKIEVILDIVFNHTNEGNGNGPTISFKGLDPHAYYLINSENQYLNYSGCGNTFNCNHPIARELIFNALRYWVSEYHVDGFRFDLAAVFNRNKHGNPIDQSPLVEFLSHDPVLSHIKLIAEPWDAAGLHELGKFAACDYRWSEWNGKYQNTVRAFIKGSSNMKQSFAGAISGSHDIFQISPYSSINYIVSHDGFSLADVVSYNEKHNLENGENNNDGTNNNESWNCGHEGPTTNKKILHLRTKQMKNLLMALMLSQGIPMICMGDEYAHTKNGNNNSWCQDTELNWFLWEELSKNANFHRFYKGLIWFRKKCHLLKFENFITDKEIKWHGLKIDQPEWDNDNKLIAFSLHEPSGEAGLYTAFNASHLNQTFEVPALPESMFWRWVVNTNNNPPKDFYEDHKVERLNGAEVHLAPYSACLLQTKR